MLLITIITAVVIGIALHRHRTALSRQVFDETRRVTKEIAEHFDRRRNLIDDAEASVERMRRESEVEVGEPKGATERPSGSNQTYQEIEEGPDPSAVASVSAQPDAPAPSPYDTAPAGADDGTFSLAQLDTILVPTVIRLQPDFVARCDEEAVLLAERAKQAADQKRQQRAARRQAKARLKADPSADLSDEEKLELVNLLTSDAARQRLSSSA